MNGFYISMNSFLERSGYHPALAKVDSAPSASVGMHGINTGLCGQTSAIHANSEASLLKIHHNKHDSTAASIMVWFKENFVQGSREIHNSRKDIEQ